jgi:Fe-S-cluster-containing dehydrogenase component
MKNWYLIIDVEKCENCNNCFLACKDEHVENDWKGYAAPQAAKGQSWITICTNERGEFPFIDVGYLPLPCMQCDNAPCMKAANDGAVYKRPDGIVIIDPEKSRGQQQIAKSCPYDAIQWNDALGAPQKCTLCAHLLDEGWTKTRCVQACPTGALSLAQADETEMNEIIKTERLETYREGLNTRPRVYYKNLYRFTRCFIGGSIAMKVGNKDECAEGARVTLLDGGSNPIAESVTDAFGDFKFDDLEEAGGTYTLRIEYTGYQTKTVEVKLTQSVYVGTILL